jgi:hypothetical protein
MFFLTWMLSSTTSWASEPSSPSDEAGHGQSTWTVAIEAIPWTAAVEEIGVDQRPRRVLRIDGPLDEIARPDEKAYRAEVGVDNVAFVVEGRLPYQRTMIWSGPVRKPATRNPYVYFCLRYRARGIERSYAPVEILSVAGRDPDDKPASLALLTVAQVLNDNRWHVVVGKKPIPFAVDTLRVKVTTIDRVKCNGTCRSSQ